jgi:hypothetical protein
MVRPARTNLSVLCDSAFQKNSTSTLLPTARRLLVQQLPTKLSSFLTQKKRIKILEPRQAHDSFVFSQFGGVDNSATLIVQHH